MELQKAMFHIIDNAITKTVPRQKRADYLFMGMFVIQTLIFLRNFKRMIFFGNLVDYLKMLTYR